MLKVIQYLIYLLIVAFIVLAGFALLSDFLGFDLSIEQTLIKIPLEFSAE